MLLGRLETFALRRVQVEQLRTLHVFYLAQNAHQLADVVTVVGTEVADVHAFEDVLLVREGRLQGIVHTDDALLTLVV